MKWDKQIQQKVTEADEEAKKTSGYSLVIVVGLVFLVFGLSFVIFRNISQAEKSHFS